MMSLGCKDFNVLHNSDNGDDVRNNEEAMRVKDVLAVSRHELGCPSIPRNDLKKELNKRGRVGKQPQ